jgi:hypothetical protein
MADIDVSVEALNRHASEIDTYMSALREAAAYGDQAFDLRAFGIIGTTWSQILHVWCSDAKNLVDASADSGGKIAAAMREMAQSYESQDTQHAGAFEKIQQQLGPVAPSEARVGQ